MPPHVHLVDEIKGAVSRLSRVHFVYNNSLDVLILYET